MRIVKTFILKQRIRAAHIRLAYLDREYQEMKQEIQDELTRLTQTQMRYTLERITERGVQGS